MPYQKWTHLVQWSLMASFEQLMIGVDLPHGGPDWYGTTCKSINGH